MDLDDTIVYFFRQSGFNIIARNNLENLNFQSSDPIINQT